MNLYMAKNSSLQAFELTVYEANKKLANKKSQQEGKGTLVQNRGLSTDPEL